MRASAALGWEAGWEPFKHDVYKIALFFLPPRTAISCNLSCKDSWVHLHVRCPYLPFRRHIYLPLTWLGARALRSFSFAQPERTRLPTSLNATKVSWLKKESCNSEQITCQSPFWAPLSCNLRGRSWQIHERDPIMISFNVFCFFTLLKAIEDHSASFAMQDALQWHFRLLLSKPRL